MVMIEYYNLWKVKKRTYFVYIQLYFIRYLVSLDKVAPSQYTTDFAATEYLLFTPTDPVKFVSRLTNTWKELEGNWVSHIQLNIRINIKYYFICAWIMFARSSTNHDTCCQCLKVSQISRHKQF